MNDQIDTIEASDPDGTHARYPVTKDSLLDAVKSSSVETPVETLLGSIETAKAPVKAFLVVDDHDEVVQSFSLNAKPMPDLTAALRAVVEVLHDCHAAMRGELTGTF